MTEQWFDEIYLENEQCELLSRLIEQERCLGPEQSGSFLFVNSAGGCFVMHPDLMNRITARKGDLDSLADCRLLRRNTASSGVIKYFYDVTPRGRRYYAEMKKRAGEAAAVIENEILQFLDAKAFMMAFPDAYTRWRQAAQDLWGADSQQQMTRIGHTCRESLQEFAASLAQQNGIEISADQAKTVQAVRAVLNLRQLGDTDRAFLNALLAYWGTVSDLVQRQEHGGARERTSLTWEDTRRVVFQTAIVMFEVARAMG